MIRNSFLSSVLLTGALLGMLLSGNIVQAETDWQGANKSIVDNHLLPRYERLAESGKALAEQAKRFCNTQNESDFERLRAAYHKATDDWMGIQHMRFGPVEMYLRYNRYQMWPDKHSSGPKQMRRLLAEEERDVLAADRFPHTSVAVQGFTALERLLYPAQLQLSDFGRGGVPAYRCEFVVAITNNIARMSAGLVKDWQSEEMGYRDLIIGAEQGNDYFESSEEVSSRLLNNLHTQLQAIVDQKLLRPLKNHKLRRAESWRSRRSLRNILLNLKATEELYSVGFAPVVTDKALDAELRVAFTRAIDAVETIKVPLYEIEKGSENNQKLEQVLETNRALKRLIATRLPQSLDLSLGFNSLDGD